MAQAAVRAASLAAAATPLVVRATAQGDRSADASRLVAATSRGPRKV